MKKRGKDKLVLVILILISLFIIFLLAYSKTKITANTIQGLSIASQTEGEQMLHIKYADSGSVLGQESGFSSDILFVPLSGKINIDASSASNENINSLVSSLENLKKEYKNIKTKKIVPFFALFFLR